MDIWVILFYIKQYNFSICHIELCVGRIDLCIGRIDFSNSGESTYFRATRLIFIRATRPVFVEVYLILMSMVCCY